MRILITGGLGFIGGRLAVYLTQLGHQVTIGSRNPSPKAAWLPQVNVASIMWDDAGSLERSCHNIDVVIQAAGMNAQDCIANPVGALAFNGVATARLFAAASRAGVKRFVYLSTAHVYANPLVGIIAETSCPANFHPYATSHLAGEHVVLAAQQFGKIQGVVLRLSNVFGAPVHKSVNCWMLLANDLCKQAVQTRKLVLQTNGMQPRDFIGMERACDILAQFATGPAAASKYALFNVGAGKGQSVLTMAQRIQQRCAKVLGFEPVVHCAQADPGGKPSTLTYNVDRLESLGIHFDKDVDADNAEIDRLLYFCQSEFAPCEGANV
jgi:UDP-glucose 4-epimerase